MRIVSFKANEYDENAYLIKDKDNVYIIDPGFNFDDIKNFLTVNELIPNKIFLTHAHIDHTGDLHKYLSLDKDIKLYISEKDYSLLYDNDGNAANALLLKEKFKKVDNITFLYDKDKVDSFIFHSTPGHTKGSMCIEYKEFLFTGDTLFKNSIGRTDLPTGSMSDMNHSLKYIMTSFKKETIILPGHYSKTTLKDEIKNNYYLKILKRD